MKFKNFSVFALTSLLLFSGGHSVFARDISAIRHRVDFSLTKNSKTTAANQNSVQLAEDASSLPTPPLNQAPPAISTPAPDPVSPAVSAPAPASAPPTQLSTDQILTQQIPSTSPYNYVFKNYGPEKTRELYELAAGLGLVGIFLTFRGYRIFS